MQSRGMSLVTKVSAWHSTVHAPLGTPKLRSLGSLHVTLQPLREKADLISCSGCEALGCPRSDSRRAAEGVLRPGPQLIDVGSRVSKSTEGLRGKELHEDVIGFDRNSHFES